MIITLSKDEMEEMLGQSSVDTVYSREEGMSNIEEEFVDFD